VRHNFYKDQQKPLTIYDLKRSDPTNTLLAFPDANGNLVPTINEATGKISGDNYVEEYNMYDRFYQFNAQIDYARTFGKHDVSAALIYEQAANNGEDVKARKSDYVVFDRPFFTDFGGTDRTRWGLDGSGWESGRVSYIGRANYTYDSKYLAEFSFRQDLSSKFGPKRKNRAGFFPSAGLAWRMSEEGFIQNGLPWINNLKLRGSIGLTGNDAIDADQWYAKANIGEDGYYTGGAANPSAGTSFGKVPNLLITWEKSLYHNIGLDVGFLNNLFTFSGQYWFKHTYDILGNPISTIPDTFGGEFGDINYGKANSFGLDFELGFNKQINKDLFVYAKGNFGWSGNKLIEYAEGNIQPWLSKIGKNWDRIAGVQADGVIQTMRDTGKTQPKHPNTSAANSPDGMVKLYEITTSTGGKYIIPADYWYTDSSRFIDNGNYNSLRPGWVFYRDLGVRDNGDGTTSGTAGYYDGNATDQTWKIDHLNPPYNYGLLLGANWKGLSLDVFLQGTAGNQKMLFLENQANTYWYGSGFDFWMSDSFSAIDNPTGKYPLIVNAPADTGFGGGSTFWVRDASFLRLKNVTVSYDLPKKILSKSGLSAVRVYVTGNNLALLWNPLKWYDPEMSGGSSRQQEEIATQYETNNPATMYNMPSGAATYPLTRTVTFGLNVSF
jgi:TonB-linked SusC/RagA family outer membrane protein